jgi:hypothetical protein
MMPLIKVLVVINEKEDTLLTTYSAVLYPVNKEMRCIMKNNLDLVPIIPFKEIQEPLTIWLSLITVSK